MKSKKQDRNRPLKLKRSKEVPSKKVDDIEGYFLFLDELCSTELPEDNNTKKE